MPINPDAVAPYSPAVQPAAGIGRVDGRRLLRLRVSMLVVVVAAARLLCAGLPPRAAAGFPASCAKWDTLIKPLQSSSAEVEATGLQVVSGPADVLQVQPSVG